MDKSNGEKLLKLATVHALYKDVQYFVVGEQLLWYINSRQQRQLLDYAACLHLGSREEKKTSKDFFFFTSLSTAVARKNG